VFWGFQTIPVWKINERLKQINAPAKYPPMSLSRSRRLFAEGKRKEKKKKKGRKKKEKKGIEKIKDSERRERGRGEGASYLGTHRKWSDSTLCKYHCTHKSGLDFLWNLGDILQKLGTLGFLATSCCDLKWHCNTPLKKQATKISQKEDHKIASEKILPHWIAHLPKSDTGIEE